MPSTRCSTTTRPPRRRRTAPPRAKPLNKKQLRIGIEQWRATPVAQYAGRMPLPALLLAPRTFLDYFDQWISEEQQKVSVRTGRQLSAKTIWTH